MKTFLIAMAALATFTPNTTELDCTPATPNPEIYAMGIEADPIDLNSICGWEENVVGDSTVLTLYTYDGNFYVLETKNMEP